MSKRWSWRSRADSSDAAQVEIIAKQIERERDEESRARRNLLRAYRMKVQEALKKTRAAPNWQDLTSAMRTLCEQSRLEFGLNDSPPAPTGREEIRGVILMPPMEDLPQ